MYGLHENANTVKFVIRGHLWTKERVVF